MMQVHEHQYSDNITKQKIVLFGLYPPPYGGVSVHMRRVADKLLGQQNKVFLFNTEQRSRMLFPWYVMKIFFCLLAKRPHQVMYHSTYLKSSIAELVVLMILRYVFWYAVTIVDHDCRHLYTRSPFSKRWYAWVVKRKQCRVVCIGRSTYQSYIDAGIPLRDYSIEHAFLPPSLTKSSGSLPAGNRQKRSERPESSFGKARSTLR